MMKAIPKSILIVLGLSLALNFFIGGLWIGKQLAHAGPDRSDRHVEFNLRGLRGALTEDQAATFRLIMREQRSTVRAKMGEQRRVKHALSEAMSAETLDIKLIESLLAEERSIAGDFREPMHQALLTLLPTLNHSERLSLVSALERSRTRPSRKKRERPGAENGDGDMPPPRP